MSSYSAPLSTLHTPRTTQNSHENAWQGHDLSNTETPTKTRVMFHNINGLRLRGTEGLEMFIQAQASLHIDIQGISEHCLDVSKFDISHAAQEITRRTYPKLSLLQLHSSQEPAVHQYKPGGTGLLLLGPVVGRLDSNGRGGDTMGRWSYVTLRRQQKPPVTIISAYQVCFRPTNQLGNTAFHQQQRALNSAGHTDIHPRNAFIRDLTRFITNLQQQQHSILLGGDFNESLTDKNSGIHRLATATTLIDPFLHTFPHHGNFGTHQLGQRRIDLVLASPDLLSSLTGIGYAPFDFSTTSDHRPVVIEFQTSTLFGSSHPCVPLNQARHLRSNDVKAVYQYITHMHDEISRRDGFQHLQDIIEGRAHPHTVEHVDNIIGECGDIAESKCRKRRPEFYSQQLVQQRIKVSILHGHLNALKAGRDRTPQLLARMKRLQAEVYLPPTQRLTKEQLTSARQALADMVADSQLLRRQEIDQKIEQAHLKGERHKARVLRSIQKVETGKRTYRMLKAMRSHSLPAQALDKLEIPATWPPPHDITTTTAQLEDPKSCTEWKTVTCPYEIEQYLMIRNRTHFSQAEGTPLTRAPYDSEFDWAASTESAEDVLAGRYTMLSTEASTCRDLLSACQYATGIDALPSEISSDEFRNKIRTWKERTTTSPSGRHLGRYKALFSRGLSDSEAMDEHSHDIFTAKQHEIAALIVAIINYCISQNYVLNRWKTIVNVMILKEPNNYKIHRLRVIHIYEADFNLILATKWRQLLRHAETHDLIHPGQYGGRPGCEAQSLTLLEELKYDLTYMTRRTLLNFDNDATSCYDRILVPFASLINRKYGMHRQIVAIHANTLHQARYRLKTASGISNLTYSHCVQYPIHGTGQGSGNSPCIWLFISSTLFELHERRANGTTFISPDGLTQVHFSMVGFVDDSTGSCNDFSPMAQCSLASLFQRMQDDAQTWNNLLYTTGGKLELPKCSFHTLHFDFRADGRPIPTMNHHTHGIHITDLETTSQIQIQAKQVFATHKTLGHHKSPVTNTRVVLQQLQQQADRLSLLISLCPISRHGAYLAYHTVFVPAIKYTLPQSFYPAKHLEQAQSQSVARVLAKCGINRNTSRALVYAPQSHAGGGFLPWYVLQGEGQLQHIMKHWRTNTLVSKTLSIAIQWAQWHSGHPISIFQDTDSSLSYLECRWITSARKFLSSIRATIVFDIPLVQPPERRHDIYIMQYARDSSLFTEKELAVINYCRLYLHVTTVSELFDATGTAIIPELFLCQREPWFNNQTYVTLQRRPSDYQIRTQWQRLCRQWSTSAGVLAASISLGEWIVPGHQLRRRRQTYRPKGIHTQVYHWHENTYWLYKLQPATRVYHRLHPTSWEPLATCQPIRATVLPDGHLLVHQCPQAPCPPPQLKIPTTFEQHILQTPKWEQQLLQDVTLFQEPYLLQSYLLRVPDAVDLYLVSDGSQKDNDLTFGWVFGTSEGLILAEHSGMGYGTPTSHRAEAWGMLSGVRFLAQLYRYLYQGRPTPPQLHRLTCYSDNSGLIQRLLQRNRYRCSYPNATLATDWDLVEQIHDTWRELPFQSIDQEWIRGHQDPSAPDLNVAAQYNIRADELAGLVSVPVHHDQHPPWLLPAEKCRLLINGIPQHGHYGSNIRRAATLPPYYQYLRGRYNWTLHTQNTVDWQVFKTATSSTTIPPIQLMKLVYRKLPTKYEMAKSNRHVDPTCPFCHSLETFPHILRCANPKAQRFRHDLMEDVEEYLVTRSAPDQFRQALILGVQSWLQSAQPTCPNDLPCAQPSYHQQDAIGWDMFFSGFTARGWRDFYEEASYSSPTTITLKFTPFMAQLINLLWKRQTEFWAQYVETAPNLSGLSWHADNRKHEYIAKIRFLHRQKNQCMPAHQTQYFHENVLS